MQRGRKISDKHENFQLIAEFLPGKTGLIRLQQLQNLNGLTQGAEAGPQDVVGHPGLRTQQVEEAISNCALGSVTEEKYALGPISEFALRLVSQYVKHLNQVARSRRRSWCRVRDRRR